MAQRDSARDYARSLEAPKLPVAVSYLEQRVCEELLDDPHVLALVYFGERSWSAPDGTQRFGVALPLLGPEAPVAEVWRSAEPVCNYQDDGLVLRGNSSCVFGHLLIEEEQHGGILQASKSAYARILDTLQAHGFPHIIRVWNYFPDINVAEDGLERYQGFCVGRHEALSAVADFERSLPAATAIGTSAPGLLIYFIAAKHAGVQVENPRQVSAFQYPSQYGPRSPSFSRAMAMEWDRGASFFISGTASVVGHATCNRDSLRGQIDETIRNLQALTHNYRWPGQRAFAFPHDLAALKVYLRRARDYESAAARLRAVFGPQVPTLFLHGDVCRDDLLMELEAVAGLSC